MTDRNGADTAPPPECPVELAENVSPSHLVHHQAEDRLLPLEDVSVEFEDMIIDGESFSQRVARIFGEDYELTGPINSRVGGICIVCFGISVI